MSNHTDDNLVQSVPIVGREGNTPSRTTRPGIPKRNGISLRKLRRSTRLSVYLYICAHYKLTDQQREFVAHFQSKLNLAEIQSALKFVHTLTTDPRTRARMQIPESQDRVETLVPTLDPRPHSSEPRRIGVGYRDKGSLPGYSRPSYDRDNTIEHGLTYQGELDRVWDLTLLLEDPEESSEVAPDGGLSAAAGMIPQAISLLHSGRVTLEQTGTNSWKISLLE